MLGTVLRQRRISTMRGVELREREREREIERERMMIRKIYVLCEGKYTIVARRLKNGVELIWFKLMLAPPFIVSSGILLKFLECSKN